MRACLPRTAASPADVAARLAARDAEDVHHKSKLTGRREGGVLDPCRLALEFSLAAGGEGPGARRLCVGCCAGCA